MNKSNSEAQPPIDCFKCKYFYVTWDQNQPRGCKAFRFKSPLLPSVVVLEASGEPCLKFTPKQTTSDQPKKKDGWIA